MENNGQVAIEYLLIFFISIIILSIISIPFFINSFETTSDIKNTIELKDTLTEISNSVRIIYSSDYASMRTIAIEFPSNSNIYYKNISGNHYICSYIYLSNGTKKEIKAQIPCKISFNNKSRYYYTSINKRWYYNTEVKWINSSNGEMNVNVYFK